MQFNKPSIAPLLGGEKSSSSSYSSSLLPVSHLSSSLLSSISSDVIGRNFPLTTPFTSSSSSPSPAPSSVKKRESNDRLLSSSSLSSSFRPLLYADFAATGRGLYRVEKFVKDRVLPLYGNTHTQESATGRHAAHLLEESRHILKMYMNADHRYGLIFCGNGASGAVTKFLQILLLSSSSYVKKRHMHPHISNSHDHLPSRRYQKNPPSSSSSPSSSSCSSSSCCASPCFSSSPSSSYLSSFFSLFEEDRWGSYLCRACGSRLKTAAHARRHMNSSHPLSSSSASSSSLDGKIDERRELSSSSSSPHPVRLHLHLEFLVDPTCHHSSFLPFRELASSSSSFSSSSSSSLSSASMFCPPGEHTAAARSNEKDLLSKPKSAKDTGREEEEEEEKEAENLFSYREEAEKAGVYKDSETRERKEAASKKKKRGGAKEEEEEDEKEEEDASSGFSGSDYEEDEEEELEKAKKSIKIRDGNVDISIGFSFLHLDSRTAMLSPVSLYNRLRYLRQRIDAFNRLEAKRCSRDSQERRKKDLSQTLSNSLPATQTGTEKKTPLSSSSSFSSSSSSSESFISSPVLHVLLPVCIFSAVSNVTGLISPVPSSSSSFSSFSSLSSMSIASVGALNRLVHRFGGLACWDYAGASSHIPIDVYNRIEEEEDEREEEEEGERRIRKRKVDFSFGDEGGAMQEKKDFEERRSETGEKEKEEGKEPVSLLSTLSSSSSLSSSFPGSCDGCTDVVFFSPHKLLGGPGSSGVLVLRKDLLLSDVPAHPGGGCVYLVSGYKAAVYELDRSENREEAGSPNLLSIVRAAASIRFLQQLPVKEIRSREERLTLKLLHSLRQHERIEIVGPLSPRVGIISFLIRYGNRGPPSSSLSSSSSSSPSSSLHATRLSEGGRGVYLHHNFVTALLNDLFGIQVRGGCLCASPYTSFLLSIHPKLLECLENVLLTTGQDIFRPGVVRLSIHGLMREEEEVDKILSALLWVASNGWKLMPKYEISPETGEWKVKGYSGRREEEARIWISNYSFLPPIAHCEEEKDRDGMKDMTSLDQGVSSNSSSSSSSGSPLSSLHFSSSPLSSSSPCLADEHEEMRENKKPGEEESLEEMLDFADSILTSHLASFKSSSSPSFHLLHLPSASCFKGYRLSDLNRELSSCSSSSFSPEAMCKDGDAHVKKRSSLSNGSLASEDEEKKRKKEKEEEKKRDLSSSLSTSMLERMTSRLLWFALPADAAFSISRCLATQGDKTKARIDKQSNRQHIYQTQEKEEDEEEKKNSTHHTPTLHEDQLSQSSSSSFPSSSSSCYSSFSEGRRSPLVSLPYYRDKGLDPYLYEEAVRWKLCDVGGRSQGKKEAYRAQGETDEKEDVEKRGDGEEDLGFDLSERSKRAANACFHVRHFKVVEEEELKAVRSYPLDAPFRQDSFSKSQKKKKIEKLRPRSNRHESGRVEEEVRSEGAREEIQKRREEERTDAENRIILGEEKETHREVMKEEYAPLLKEKNGVETGVIECMERREDHTHQNSSHSLSSSSCSTLADTRVFRQNDHEEEEEKKSKKKKKIVSSGRVDAEEREEILSSQDRVHHVREEEKDAWIAKLRLENEALRKEIEEERTKVTNLLLSHPRHRLDHRHRASATQEEKKVKEEEEKKEERMEGPFNREDGPEQQRERLLNKKIPTNPSTDPVSPSSDHASHSSSLSSSSSTPSSRLARFPSSSSSTVRLKIPRGLRRTVGEAIREFNMIREGDRLLVGVSGGKDSLTLLHILRDLQRRAPIHFDLAAATVDPVTPEFNPKPLIPYMQMLGVKYHYLRLPIMALAKTHMGQRQSICAFCSRLKRGLLYSCMRKHGYNVLVLGQHLDDICESFLMSALHNGSLNTMKAHYVIRKGDLRVCRPLIRTREKETSSFAVANRLPLIADNCPACFAAPKERHRMKLLLSEQETEFPQVFQNLLKCVKPLISISAAEGAEEDEEEDEEEKNKRKKEKERRAPSGMDQPSTSLSRAQSSSPLQKHEKEEEKKCGSCGESPKIQERASSQVIEEDLPADQATVENLLRHAGCPALSEKDMHSRECKKKKMREENARDAEEAAELVMTACGINGSSACCYRKASKRDREDEEDRKEER